MVSLLLFTVVQSWAFFVVVDNITTEIVAISDIEIVKDGYTSFQVSTTTVKQMLESEGIKGLAIISDAVTKEKYLVKDGEEVQRKAIQKKMK